MIDASWIVADRNTGKPVLDTYNFELVQFINLQRYKVYTAHAWLVHLNREIQAGETWMNG